MTTSTFSALASERDVDIQVTARRVRTRWTTWIWVGRVAVVLIVIGGWQWFTVVGWVDKFFYGQPSMIWDSLVHLFTVGTAFGSIWDNLGVTVEEAFLGFLLGTVIGVVIGILFGSNSISPWYSGRTSRF